ncbi:YjzC family protein [Marinicrinis sediminis]|uniref:YjzC family protein n=1 Tax=Marinicrinis sediminis TaxID=1652465 RepID=A0ABW5RBM6_9BACL
MGQQTEFEPGDKVPNNGHYIEVGETAFHMGIENPQMVELERGDTFPDTTNKDRKWKLKRKGR